MSMVEKIAAIIDPYAFKHRDQLFRFCIGRGDSEKEAHETADWAHGAQCNEAMTKARAAIEALMEPTEAMLDAGDDADGYDVYVGVWTAMIQAALKEGQ